MILHTMVIMLFILFVITIIISVNYQRNSEYRYKIVNNISNNGTIKLTEEQLKKEVLIFTDILESYYFDKNRNYYNCRNIEKDRYSQDNILRLHNKNLISKYKSFLSGIYIRVDDDNLDNIFIANNETHIVLSRWKKHEETGLWCIY